MNEQLFDAYKTYYSVGNYIKAWECLYHLYKQDKKSAYPMICSFRDSILQNTNPDVREIIKKSYDLTGRDYFDDFMIALEWNRDLKDKYWLPRRNKLMLACNYLQDLEDDRLDELFLSMPPRVGKTTLILFFMLWVMLRNSERSNLYVSYTDSVVEVFYTGLIEIMTDKETYRWEQIFPECKLVNTNAKDKLLNVDRKKRYASFTGRSLYGTLNGACDCNGYIVGDDLISGIEEAMNKDRLNSAWLKVDNNMLPRAKQNAKRLWIGTRWSMIDPIARRIDLLENDIRCRGIKYAIINFPALDSSDESNFDYACGVGFDTEYYRQRRASFERNGDMASFLAQYMGEPIERDGSVFAPDEMRYYNGVLPDDIEPDRIFMVVDPAWGGTDYVAATLNYQYGDDLYVADIVYNAGDKRETQPLIVSKAIKHNVSYIYVEGTKMTASYGEEIDSMLRKKGHKINVQISAKHFTGNGKVQRIFDKSVSIKEQMVFLYNGVRSKEYEMAMQNLFSFSVNGKNKHDDFPDVCAMTISAIMSTNQILSIKSRRF